MNLVSNKINSNKMYVMYVIVAYMWTANSNLVLYNIHLDELYETMFILVPNY